MTAVYKRELRSYFNSMTGYIFLGFFVLIVALYFSLFNILGLSADFSMILSSVLVLFLILVPTITMRLLSEEARYKTDQLLLTSPANVSGIVLGKYFAAVTLFVIALLITAIFPISMSFYGEVSLFETVGTYFGFFLIGSGFIAVGLWVSSLTDNQIVSAVATFAILFLFFMMENIAAGLPTGRSFSFCFAGIIIILVAFYIYNASKNIKFALGLGVVFSALAAALYFINPQIYDDLAYKAVNCLAVVTRYSNFALGIFDLSAVVYYVTFSAGFIYLTIRVVEKRRWSL